jgi:hypothetical protein
VLELHVASMDKVCNVSSRRPLVIYMGADLPYIMHLICDGV